MVEGISVNIIIANDSLGIQGINPSLNLRITMHTAAIGEVAYSVDFYVDRLRFMKQSFFENFEIDETFFGVRLIPTLVSGFDRFSVFIAQKV
jgi:hypothetical protein